MHAPIVRAIAQHAQATPEKAAVIVEAVGRPSHALTYGALMDLIGPLTASSASTSSTHTAPAVPHGLAVKPAAPENVPPLFDPAYAPYDQVIHALSRLAKSEAIVGSTSGSTGQAKRYYRSQDSWVASFAMDQKMFGLRSSDVILAPGSLSHSLFSYALCHGLYIGATVVLSERFRPDHVVHQVASHNATVLYGVPTQLKLIAQVQGEVCSSVRWVLSSGARWFGEITPALQAMFPNAVIAEFYGASELSFVSVALHGGPTPTPAGSVGRPAPGVQVQIDSDQIWVSSPGLFERYLSNTPTDFFERVDVQGVRWCSVGDLGRLDTDGYLYLSGRQSRKIIVSGKNLYPEEVEQALLGYPGITQAAVLGLEDALRGERIVGIVVADPLPTRAQLIAHLRPLVDDYKIPREFFYASQLSMTNSGKTDFAAVRSLFQAGECIVL